jgi:hypothetical protein
MWFNDTIQVRDKNMKETKYLPNGQLNCPGNHLDSCTGCNYWRLGNPKNKCTWDGHPDNMVQELDGSKNEPVNCELKEQKKKREIEKTIKCEECY